MPLDKSELRSLRSQAHGLNPRVKVGADGVTPGVAQAMEVEFKKAELVKVACGRATAESAADAAAALAAATASQVVQVIGRTFTLFRERRESEIEPVKPAKAVRPRGGRA